MAFLACRELRFSHWLLNVHIAFFHTGEDKSKDTLGAENAKVRARNYNGNLFIDNVISERLGC